MTSDDESVADCPEWRPSIVCVLNSSAEPIAAGESDKDEPAVPSTSSCTSQAATGVVEDLAAEPSGSEQSLLDGTQVTELVDQASTTSIDGTKDIGALDAETDMEPFIESTKEVVSVAVESPSPQTDSEPIKGVAVHFENKRPVLGLELDAPDKLRHDCLESRPQVFFCNGYIDTQAGESQAVEDDRPEKHPALSLAHVLIANEDQTLPIEAPPASPAIFAPSSLPPVFDVRQSRQTTFLGRGTSLHVESQASKEVSDVQDDQFASILITSAEVNATAHDHVRPSFDTEASVNMDVEPSSLSQGVGSKYRLLTTSYDMQDVGGRLPGSKRISSTLLDRNPTTQTPCCLGEEDDQRDNIVEDSTKLSKKNGPPHTTERLQIDPTAERLQYDTDRAVRSDRRDRLAAEIVSRASQALKTCLTSSGPYHLYKRELSQEMQRLTPDLAPLNSGSKGSRKRKAADDGGCSGFTKDISKHAKSRHDHRSVASHDDLLGAQLPDAPEPAGGQALRGAGKKASKIETEIKPKEASQPIVGDDDCLPPRKKARKSEESTNDRFSRIKSAARTLAGAAVAGVGVFAYLAASNPDPI